MDTEPTDALDATSPAQMRALSHPLRHRILSSFGDEGATISQLSNRLKTNKGNVAHHLGVLVEAGLARKDRTRTVRGGTEQYYVRVARRLRFSTGDGGAATKAMLATMGEEIPPDDNHLLNHRHLKLTAAQAAALSEHLDRVVNDLQPANKREAEYGVVVGVWRVAGQ
ncbi:ArsR/SmtB family transcription factor [Luteipulveratus mongoliensis]|uniref:HTH arsR-type domain-containing protein n=1 Tax=Luteipulveratus mongoliensis TaxID=571913 RepID=A0A0K1JFU6_9MICO|nr:winged helix-turn-helix domain-containing protein [Luteipulveratus mongoliensis]AKU15576.1 hypothetical protein VV02_06410 [Luteipulveratus mongoliensis]